METQNQKITKQDFIAYQEVRFSGITNMFDAETVSNLSGLSRTKIIEIMKNYSTYAINWD